MQRVLCTPPIEAANPVVPGGDRASHPNIVSGARLHRIIRVSAARLNVRILRGYSGLSFIAIFIFVVGGSVSTFGQETINYASVSGQVNDSAGAAVAGADVTARQTETNLVNHTTTDQEGRFRFPYLKVGSYEIVVRQEGFAESTTKVTLTVGASFNLPVALSVESTQEHVTVNGESAVIETARTQVAGTVAQNEIKNLPLNGRSFFDLLLVLPGVSPTNTASTQLFPETSAIPGQGISVSSQRNFSNSFIVDGLSANDDAAGLPGTFFGLDSIREFQVVTSGGQAEFGRALGGYISMVTNSGSNDLHGTAYGFFRNDSLNAANALTNAKQPMTQAQYGGSLGGPIIRNRTFFFSNFEQRMLNQDGLITISQANVNAINSRNAAVGYGGPVVATGLYPNPVHLTTYLGKVDHQFSQNDQFNARYNLYDVHSSNSRGAGALSATSAAAGLNDLDQTVAASNIYTISPRTVNETRAQFTNSDLKAPPNDATGPAVNISGVASFGTLSGSPTGRLDRLFEIADNLSHQQGAHALRAGVDFLYNSVTITYPQSIRGSYSFASLASFLTGNYSTFTQTFGNPVVPQTNPNIGFYVQDQWQVSSRLTLNAGLRYDLEFLKTISTDTNNVSPRLGFAWTPFTSRSTVIRGGAGLYYDRVPLRPLANAILSGGNTTDIANAQLVSTTLNFGQTGAPVYPNVLSSAPAGSPISFSTMDPNIQNAYSFQAGLEIEHEIGRHGSISLSYQHLRGYNLIANVNLNVPACTSAVDPRNLCRPNPAFQNNKQYRAAGDSQYDGLSFSYVERPVEWGSFRISYTFSKALDDVGEFFFSSPVNNFNIRQDWGLSDDDQRHRLVFDATLHSSLKPAHNAWQHISNGFQLSGILQYYSALPFNIVSGVNTIQQTGGRPCPGLAATNPACTLQSMIGRNTGQGFDYFNLNARLSRSFSITERIRIEGIAEAFNVLNHRNNLIPNTTFGTDVFPLAPRTTFGQPTAVGDPRQIQLGLRILF